MEPFCRCTAAFPVQKSGCPLAELETEMRELESLLPLSRSLYSILVTKRMHSAIAHGHFQVLQCWALAVTPESLAVTTTLLPRKGGSTALLQDLAVVHATALSMTAGSPLLGSVFGTHLCLTAVAPGCPLSP